MNNFPIPRYLYDIRNVLVNMKKNGYTSSEYALVREIFKQDTIDDSLTVDYYLAGHTNTGHSIDPGSYLNNIMNKLEHTLYNYKNKIVHRSDGGYNYPSDPDIDCIVNFHKLMCQ